MREGISVFLSIVLTCGLMPGAGEASNSRDPYEETSKLSNGWNHTIDIYTSEDNVWGEGMASDPDSLDADETPTRWLSYTFHDGTFKFVGSDDGYPVEVSIVPDDVTCTSDSEGNLIVDVDIAAPDEGPQPLWPVVLLVVAAALVLSCDDDGCACGHHGGTPNHPGSNPPEDPGSPPGN